MFKVNEDLSIYCTRGDIGFLTITALQDGEPYTFQSGDVLCFTVCEKKDCGAVVLRKKFPISEDTQSVDIALSSEDTRIGETISKPQDYWYEVELNPDDVPQTIIGYDEDGAKVFRLFPEGMVVE